MDSERNPSAAEQAGRWVPVNSDRLWDLAKAECRAVECGHQRFGDGMHFPDRAALLRFAALVIDLTDAERGLAAPSASNAEAPADYFYTCDLLGGNPQPVAPAGQAAAPEIDHQALIEYGWEHFRYRKGTKECVAFARGAVWMREQVATEAWCAEALAGPPPDHPAWEGNAGQAAAGVQGGVPDGYMLVMVPKLQPHDEPDWEECIRQAEVATGLKVERNTLSIVIREVRRWLAGRSAGVQGAVTWIDQETLDCLTKNTHGALAYRRWLSVCSPDEFRGRTIPLYTHPAPAVERGVAEEREERA